MTQPNTIRTLSDSELLHKLDTLAERERKTTLDILLHLNEIERRGLYLTQGYPSLFCYCTGRLGYSESATSRRIRTARCIRDYPEVLELLRTNQVNVTTISIFALLLKEEDKDEVLRLVAGRTQREVEAVVARYRPRSRVHDRVTPVVVAKPDTQWMGSLFGESVKTATAGSATETNDKKDIWEMSPTERWLAMYDDPAVEEEVLQRVLGKWPVFYRRTGGKKLTTRDHHGAAPSATSDDTTLNNPNDGEIEQQFKLEFAVSPEFMKKLDEVKALLSNRYPAGIEFAQLFEAVIDEFIDRHSPKKKQERREKRKQKSENARIRGGSKAQPIRQRRKKSSAKDGRYIPPATKDKVFTRDGGKCTYVSANGKRCNSTWGLHIDHIEPYARGGTNGPGNLRLLCGKHNRLEAERILGAGIGAHPNRRE